MSVGLFAVPGSPEPVMVPETLSAAHPVISAPVSAEFPIDFVAVVWTGSEEGHEGAAVRLRHGGTWGEWEALEDVLPSRARVTTPIACAKQGLPRVHET